MTRSGELNIPSSHHPLLQYLPNKTLDTTNMVSRNRSWTEQQSRHWSNLRLHKAICFSQNYFFRFFRKYSISFSHFHILLRPQQLFQQTRDVQLTSKERPVPGHHPVLDQGHGRMHMCNLFVRRASCTKNSACSKRHTNDTLRIKSISFRGKLWCGNPRRRR